MTEYIQVCIRPDCESEDFEDLRAADGSPSPARKCLKCGLIMTMFKTKAKV